MQNRSRSAFGGYKNVPLLSSAEAAGFELFFTIDKSLRYQQNLSGRLIAIMLVRARSNRLHDVPLYLEECRSRLTLIQPGEVIVIGE